MKKVLTMAGSDSSGGAGIQADLKTFETLDVYGMCALTVIVSMNPNEKWSHNVFPIEINVTASQLDTICSTGLDAMKTGMLPSVEMIQLAAQKIDQYNISNVVIDPVMICKGTDEVLLPENTVAMKQFLLPKATVVTPNLFEAGQLANVTPINTIKDMIKCAEIILSFGAKSVYMKGGTRLQATDLFYDGNNTYLLKTSQISTTYTHGAGCTTAAAITANLAKGLSVFDSCVLAKKYVSAAITHGWKLNEFVGPVRHGAFEKFEKVDVSIEKIN